MNNMNVKTPTTSADHCCDKRYKAAIVLNNAAVVLLERDRYKDAVDMLHIAIYLVQLTFCSVGSFDPTTTLPKKIHVTEDDISRHLMNAAKFQSNKRYSSTWSKNADILIVSTQHSDGKVGELLSKASQGGTKVVFGYIVIEPIDFDDINLDSVYHDSMLILYNFGVAHYSLAGQIDASNCVFDDRHRCILVQDLQQSAYQIFNVIEAYVCRRISSTLPTPYQESGLLMLSALFSYTKSTLATQMRDTTVSEYYYVSYIAILFLIDQQGKTFPKCILQAPAA